MSIAPWRRVLALLFSFALVATACGDDGEEEVDNTGDPSEQPDESGESDGTGDDGDEEGQAEELDVEAIDFSFVGLPDTVAAGTAISLNNTAEAELHEFVAVKLPDDEERSVQELLELPESELGPLFAGVTDVIVALPGQTDAPGAVEGDGVLDEPGRYAIICAIPTGIDPQVYLQAAQEAEGGPPEVEGGGPPHFVQGMFAELIVE